MNQPMPQKSDAFIRRAITVAVMVALYGPPAVAQSSADGKHRVFQRNRS